MPDHRPLLSIGLWEQTMIRMSIGTAGVAAILFVLWANLDAIRAQESKAGGKKSIAVNIIGVINDGKFTVKGKGSIDPKSGDADIELTYSDIPKNWSPLMYCDPLVLLAGYGETAGGRNFLSLSPDGYDAEATFDFGGGMMLRKTARIRVEGDSIIADYSISGTAHVGNISAVKPYKEHLIPLEGGQFLGIGLAKWDSKDGAFEAVVSTRYRLKTTNKDAWAKVPSQIRSFEADANLDGKVFKATYKTNVQAAKSADQK